MDRIIQGYKMGGKVKYYNEGTPKTVTGLPAGGNAASAISSYLTAPLSGTLSYDPNAVQQGALYLEAAKERQALREALNESSVSSADQSQILNDADRTAQSANMAGGSLGNYTTYGGHKDVAHAAIDKAYNDFSNSNYENIKDNPAFNQGVKDTYENKIATWKDKDGNTVSKTYGDLKDTDFNGAGLSAEDQSRLAANSMMAAGIKNVGGSYFQDDSTNFLSDIYGNVTSSLNNLLEGNGVAGTVVEAISAPISTYTAGTDKSDENYAKRDAERIAKEYQDDYDSGDQTIEYDYGYGYNGGGPIGYNAGSRVNPSGVSLAQSRIDEEQLRQRNIMNAQVSQNRGPLSQITNQLAGKALGNGLQSAALKAGVSTIPGIGPLLSMFL
tara:strand:+ start:183 stop:1337 length:1155 start_codon:yes stop_codon:yes gene_type:complete